MAGHIFAGTGSRAVIAALLLTAGAPAAADTLRDALSAAYATNPDMLAARARQRQVDEGVPLAKAQGRLGISTEGGYSENLQRMNTFSTPRRQVVAGVNADLPVFEGGAVRNAVKAARVRVEAGRAQLRTAEASIFTDVVSAYMDVIRDEAIVALNSNQVHVLETNLQASKDRFEVGDLTRTDVAQSEARLSFSRSQLEAAQARLVSSRENYLAVVGKAPEALEAPPPLPGLPETVDAAVELALAENPQLLAARKEGDAARYDVGVAEAARMPRISATASGNYYNYLHSLGPNAALVGYSNHETAATVGVQARLPIYQGGGPGARVRQAEARASETLENVISAERTVIAQTRSAYASYSASEAVILSSQHAVSANELALEGVRAENSVGTRDVLDVLNAEQELLNARVQLVSAKRDAYVAGFALLAMMGRAEAPNLGLDGGTLYDPMLNYRRVRNAIWDWAGSKKVKTQATRTVGITPLPSAALQPLPPQASQQADPVTPMEPAAPAPVTNPAN